MNQNPYNYTGPLDMKEDALVCVPRTKEVNKVIEGVMRGDYWAILGPRQIGKTTFLRLLRKEFPKAYYLTVDFEVPQAEDEKGFYQWLITQFEKEIPHYPLETLEAIADGSLAYSPALQFFNFLESFKPREKKKVVLLFDEINALPFVRNFLHVWRKVFHERYDKNELERYAVVITGSVELVALTIGPNSPFNIAKKVYLKDFSDEESRKLIEEPLIEIEKKAKEKLLSQVSGHPQMLQHACHILVERAGDDGIKTETDVDEAIETLLIENSNIDTLRAEIELKDVLRDLITSVLKGEKLRLSRYKEFSISGAGSIVAEGKFCAIRNKVYEKFLRDLIDIPKSDLNEDEYRLTPNPVSRQEEDIGEFDSFFICNNEDFGMTKSIRKELVNRGLKVWIDTQDLLPGSNFQEEINRLFSKIRSVVVLVGRSGEEPWKDIQKRRIMSQAVQRQVPVIPIILPGIEKEPDLPAFLRHKQWIKFESGSDDIQALNKLEYAMVGKEPKKIIRGNDG